ncbi:PD-(D/E)XK nuclease-like domain-containing protein [Nocardia puris]|uniref:PD-(D/E)XK nuclease-like domain-containing protein n=1 Tax=Nocardia puris TaxID=208602 RepID=UPI001895A73A|nr:PD-(D/E)XK nuclease-like domain-containing protein [Nocardia puris]MBF6368390.1 PD-(D/E)XK nuclease-like domain-containing protein [Nocardia puris]
MTAPTTPGLYPDIPEGVYHGDPDSLSSTAVRTLVRPGGPAKHVGAVTEDSDVFDIGKAAHTLLLGAGAGIREVAADTWQTKEARAARAEARAAGQIPLLAKQAAATREMVAVALAHPEVAEVLSSGRPEVSAYAMDPVHWVMLRARFDWLVEHEDGVEVLDYKTTKNAAPGGFERSAAEYGYHIQEAHYRRVLEELGIRVKRFRFLAQEKTPPYLPCWHEYEADAIEAGHRVVDEAVEIFAACRAVDDWPGYGASTNRMILPPWAFGKW